MVNALPLYIWTLLSIPKVRMMKYVCSDSMKVNMGWWGLGEDFRHCNFITKIPDAYV